MGPFTRVDARDLALALAASGAWFVFVSLWPSSETTVWSALGMVPLWFLMTAPGRAPEQAPRPPEGLRSRRRTEKALRSGTVPDGTDRELWVSYLSFLPNTTLLRHRTRWVLVVCAAVALAGVCAVGASALLEIGDPLTIAGVLVVTLPTAVVGVVLAQMLPAIWVRAVEKMLRTLREAP